MNKDSKVQTAIFGWSQWHNKLILAVIVFLPSSVLGQNVYHHSSTVEEGYLTGLSRYYSGLGQYARQTAEATVILEQARKLHIDNWEHYVNTRNAIKDEWKERHSNKYLENWAKRIETKRLADALATLDGPHGKPALIHEGVRYSSFDEFKSSPAFIEMKERLIREQEDEEIVKALEEVERHEAMRRTALREKGYID